MVLLRSEVFSAYSSTWKGLVEYASERPNYRLVCLPSKNDQLQATVEAVGGEDIRRASQYAWDGLQKALKGKPKVTSAEIYELGSSRPIMTAQTGFLAEVRRREIINLLVVGVGTAIWVGVGALTFAKTKRRELFGGGLPGLLGGVVALVFGHV
jgi:hypothetical protein